MEKQMSAKQMIEHARKKYGFIPSKRVLMMTDKLEKLEAIEKLVDDKKVNTLSMLRFLILKELDN